MGAAGALEVQTERARSEDADSQAQRSRSGATTELIVMQNGAIVEQGTVEELMASKGHYFQVRNRSLRVFFLEFLRRKNLRHI